MNDEQEEGSSASSTSSSTRLPISTGPENFKYSFSSFPSSSPALLSPGSSNSSTEKLFNSSKTRETAALLRFSLEHSRPTDDSSSDSSCCLMELLQWFIRGCCCCCAWNLNTPSKLH
ncbi:uncharacterized protein LOC130813220 [Amaranthus tricolor]|uniref:uncharacterized protein LOC130813220 n=1 Tax=Amaranthus tricolor TaxID=29722 RepID=UPI0025878598|nr:uncharacterized protein LOC130813220 [Amaranthus tricolor]